MLSEPWDTILGGLVSVSLIYNVHFTFHLKFERFACTTVRNAHPQYSRLIFFLWKSMRSIKLYPESWDYLGQNVGWINKSLIVLAGQLFFFFNLPFSTNHSEQNVHSRWAVTHSHIYLDCHINVSLWLPRHPCSFHKSCHKQVNQYLHSQLIPIIPEHPPYWNLSRKLYRLLLPHSIQSNFMLFFSQCSAYFAT